MKKVLYPGSFDPITYGHMNIVEQALAIFDKVVIAVLVNSSKSGGWFTLEERKSLIEEIYQGNPNVEVIAVSGRIAAVDVAVNNDCNTMVTGLRDLTDFAYEKHKAEVNLAISKGDVNTIALFANPKNATISSSTVKELVGIGKSVEDYIHPIVIDKILDKFKEG